MKLIGNREDGFILRALVNDIYLLVYNYGVAFIAVFEVTRVALKPKELKRRMKIENWKIEKLKILLLRM